MARLSTHDETADPANATHGNRLRVAILFCVIPRYKQVLKMVTSCQMHVFSIRVMATIFAISY